MCFYPPTIDAHRGIANLEIPADRDKYPPGRATFNLLDGSLEVVEPGGECEHCGEPKSRKMLTDCEACGESICPDCAAKGCSGPIQPEPNNAFDCFNQAVSEMGEKFPLEKDAATRVLQWCDRALKFGFAPHHCWHAARTHRLRGEALESLGQKAEALQEYELAVEKDPNVGVKKRLAALRKECTQS
jgi:tetratricopeptide (TPR) repeat protein